MTELLIYRGLPASGKTTSARAWVAQDPANRARVNRDDLRRMLHAGYDPAAEQYVRVARDRLVKALLDQGVSVACDDTNLPQKVARGLAQLGRHAGAAVRVCDFSHVDVAVCVQRDSAREEGERVGAEVIQGMADRFLRGGRGRLAPILDDDGEVAGGDDERDADGWYKPKAGTPMSVMVDLDGTLCIHDGRSPYDETLVHTDKPNPAVVATVLAMANAGYQIIFCSGRSEACVDETLEWIQKHLGDHPRFDALWMRPVDDRRRDSIVKLELFDRYIRDHYDVAFVLDDRQQVVDAWRSIGLPVFQVAPGDF